MARVLCLTVGSITTLPANALCKRGSALTVLMLLTPVQALEGVTPIVQPGMDTVRRTKDLLWTGQFSMSQQASSSKLWRKRQHCSKHFALSMRIPATEY